MSIEHVVINPADYAVRLTTTLNLLHKAGACALRYSHLIEKLGGVSFDHDAPINLLTILQHNGVNDCLWSLRATAENSGQVASLMAADFLEAALPIYDRAYPGDPRPRFAIETKRAFAIGKIDAVARDAARAKCPAAWDDAWGNPWDAARSAVRAAVWDASPPDGLWMATWRVARDAAQSGLERIVRQYLLPDGGVA